MKNDNLKKAVAAVLFKNGKILAVSRKTDSRDFGLPGGKVDEGEDLYQAISREVYEETGITILNFYPIFTRKDDEYKTVTFFVESWLGHSQKMEKGNVSWVEYNKIENGSFGKYNSQLKKTLLKKKKFLKGGFYTCMYSSKEQLQSVIYHYVDNKYFSKKYKIEISHKGSNFVFAKAFYCRVHFNGFTHIIIDSDYGFFIFKEKEIDNFVVG